MWYNIESPMGNSIKENMQRALIAYCEARGIAGDSNLREIRPEDFGQTAPTITITAGETSYTLTRDIKEGCGIVIGGFTVLDDIIRDVDLYKGEGRLHRWNLGPIYNRENKEGLTSDIVMWARGDTMKLIFHAKAVSTADQVSYTWPLGFVLGPHMFSSATRAA